jgi:hypothetical protein
MVIWEYKQVTAYCGRGNKDVDFLDALGAEGWELAAVIYDKGDKHLTFKRPKPVAETSPKDVAF